MKAPRDFKQVHQIGDYKVSFDFKDWQWNAVNIFGFGVCSAITFEKLIKEMKLRGLK
tara:strand:+ start:354 stop:524 length:171 start_codon:yes stop_codon:yes gene_type:complete